MSLLKIDKVSKTFQDNLALNNISFEIEQGKIYGLLGPNGAGKTTLIRHITQIFLPDEGQLFYNGEKLQAKHINEIGYMPEERGLYKKMKVGEHLLYLARLRGLDNATAKQKIDFYIHKFDIESWWNKEVGELSKGMQQKIQFIATVLHQPKLLILDEPFSGLDPVNAQIIKEEIFNLHNQGMTIIFSTHRMENVEEICEEIILINKGNILIDGKVKDIKEKYKENKYKLEFYDNVVMPENISQQYQYTNNSETDYVFTLQENQQPNELLKLVLQNNLPLKAFQEILPSINEIFIKTVNQ
ncbi:MAG: ABC transporter ATP-binding protein [Chitinophagales bacterium]|nr:ABC transporter ATP-binding protein [Chitinophagales bacterium]